MNISRQPSAASRQFLPTAHCPLPTYGDSYIEHWGEVFTAHPCLRGICTFEQFLARPQMTLAAVIGGALLPRQRAVQRRIDAQCQDRGSA
jgi:hypothetical protein